MKKQLIIIDNFYDNVNEVREFALSREFSTEDNKTKSYTNSETKNVFQKIIGKKIKDWGEDNSNGFFEYTTKETDKGFQRESVGWCAMLFLSPKVPTNSGLGFYKHKQTGIIDNCDYKTLSDKDKKIVDGDCNDPSKWKLVDFTANKYNRLVLFRLSRTHKNIEYFGSTKKDGALFQKWVFETEEKVQSEEKDHFSVAEVYKESKKWERAITAYEKVIEKGEDPVKVYWSYYSIGFCKEKLHGFQKGLEYYLKSYEYRNTRLEGVYRAIKHFREKGQHKECFSLGLKVLSKGVNLVAPDELFVEKSVYDYALIFELSISAYYVGNYKLSHDLTKKIMDEKKHPESLSELLKSNIQFSIDKLKNTQIVKKQSPKAPIYSKMEDKIFVIYQYFLHGEEERRKELTECLKRNAENPLIDNIILLNERIYTNKELGIKSDKIKQIDIKDRLKFSHIFEYVEKEKLNGYIITCNADIFFDKSLENLYISGMDRNKIMYGQLRFEYNNKDLDKCRLFGPRADSQDTWIFHSNYNIENSQRAGFDFHYGVGGCDNRVLHNFDSLGFTVINDPYFVKTYHNHKAPMTSRQWIHKPLTPRPYLYMEPYLEKNQVSLFWQYPVITEKVFAIQNKGIPNFFGMPWATIIDKNINLQSVYNLIKSQVILGKKYYTCCQHIHFRKILPFLKLIGVETVYSPHKVLGEDKINGIEIKPCPLYPVNVEDPDRNGAMKGVDLIEKERPFLYSFAGGWQRDYLTDIRPRIFELHDPNRKDIYIRNTGDWHFNQVVYNCKQNKDGELNEDSVHKQKTQDYLELLLNSRFTLAPSGTGPNSIRFWEALGTGSIPVLLADTLELPKHELWKEAIIFLPEKDLEKIDNVLAEISPEKEKKMRNNCLKLYNYFRYNYANNLDKIIVHYCCGSYEIGDVGGVARYDYHIKCTFPQRIFVKQKDPKLLELCKKYGSRLIVITDNHLACDVPNDITTYLVHHGCALTTAKYNPGWNKFWRDLCVNGQKKMLSYRNPETTTIISTSTSCTDDFTEYFGEQYKNFERIDILHSSKMNENRYIKEFNSFPRVLGNWSGLKKGKLIIPKIIEKAKDYKFTQLKIGLTKSGVDDFNNRKQDIYLSHDIFLQISNSEGFSYAALDAVLCGLPLVSTKVGFCYKDMPEDCFVPLEIDRISDCDYILSKLNYAWENRETIGRKGREWYMKNCRFSDWKNKMIHTILNQKSHKNITYSPSVTIHNKLVEKLPNNYKINRGLVEWTLDPKAFAEDFDDKCKKFDIDPNSVKFYSQQDEDKYIIQHILKEKITDGTYLEIGAYDGVSYSNTKTLEDYFNFKGILIEPQKQYYEKLTKNRSSGNELYNYAVTNQDSEYIEFIGDNAEAGVSENINTDLTKKNWSKYKVKNIKLKEILEKSMFKYIDIMSIDVEGGELELLKSIDFSFPIFCIIIEAHSDQQEKNKVVAHYLSSKGFTYKERQRGNEVWLNKNYFRINLFNSNLVENIIPSNNITYSSNISDSNEIIKKLIQKNEPFSVTRLGDGESKATVSSLENQKLSERNKIALQRNAGIYYNTEEDIKKYAEYYSKAIRNSDFLASFPNLYVREQNYFIDKYSLKTLHNRVLEPFHIGKEPWSLYLSGKKVLVINPFVESFKKQMKNGFRIFKDREIFKKEQDFVYYKSFNTQAGNRLHKDWFETFELMCKDIKEIEFDIALLGCGGYGLPLCDYIKSDLKKSAIYIGGGLQLLFGVMGGRWEKNKMWEKIIRENECKFIRPSGKEVINGNSQIENSCYW